MMGEDKSPVYREDGIHLCVDNCKANRLAEEGTYLRVIYPTSEQLSCMSKAPCLLLWVAIHCLEALQLTV